MGLGEESVSEPPKRRSATPWSTGSPPLVTMWEMQPAKQQKKQVPAKAGVFAPLHLALAALALAILVAIGYYNSLDNGFVWDDHQQIVMNPALRPATPLTRIFISDIRFAHQDAGVQNLTYRPLQMLTYRIVANTFGTTPAPFHLVNLLLAIACALSAFAVFRLLTRSTFTAFAAGALFALFPPHTEAVDWIAASPDLGCALFFLIAFALLLAQRRSKPFRQSAWLLPALALVSFALSLLWKESAAVLPLLVTVYVLVVERKSLRAALKASAAYWAVLGLYLVIRFSVLGGFATGVRDWALTPLQFLLTIADLIFAYWLKLAWPFELNAYHVLSPVRSITDPRALAAIVFLLPAFAGLIYLVRRLPLTAFSALWVCITLLPALDLYALGRNAFAERYLYLPSVGFCLLVVLAATLLVERAPSKLKKPLAIALLAIVVGTFAIVTLQRNPDWKDDRTLFTATLLRSPNAPFVLDMVASVESNDSPGSASAEQHYLQAITFAQQQTPPDRLDLAAAYKGLATLYADRSDTQQALAMIARARETAPTDPEIDAEEAFLLVRVGRWDEAEPLLDKAIAAQPENENVLSTLGLVAWQHHHDAGRAIEFFSKALATHPDKDGFSASIHNNLGGVFGEQRNLPSAIQQYKLAITDAPTDPEYHVNLANVLGAAGLYDEAKTEAETALSIAPNDPGAREVIQNLGTR
jgi:tetratricopeptide (TPR) repeat protein